MARTSTTIGSSGTSATAKVRDARRDAYLAEMGGGTITTTKNNPTTTTSTTKNNPTTTTTSTKTTGSNGYVSTYGPNALYTGAGNTATSNTQSSTGGTKQTNAGTGTTAPTPTKSTGSSGRRTGTGGLPKGLSAVSPPTTAQRLTDRDAYDTGVRNGYAERPQSTGNGYILPPLPGFGMTANQEYVQQTQSQKPIMAAETPASITFNRYKENPGSFIYDHQNGLLTDNSVNTKNTPSSQTFAPMLSDYSRKQELEQLKAQPGVIPVPQRNDDGSIKYVMPTPNIITQLSLAHPASVNDTPKRSGFDTVLDMVNHAAGIFVTGVSGFLEGAANFIPAVEGFIMGEDDPSATFTGQLLQPLTTLTEAFNDWTQRETNQSAQNWQQDLADEPVLLQKSAKLAVSAMAALPYLAVVLASGGGAAVAGSTTTAANGATVLSGAGNVSLSQLTQSAVSQMVTKPAWQVSFAQSYGNSYNNAKASGASELETCAAAVLTAYINATIEQSGGLEQLPKSLQQIDLRDPRMLLDWLKAGVAEGVEEAAQGVSERAIEKAVYDPDKKVFSLSDSDAVFSGKAGAEELAGGTILGTLFSAAASAGNNIINTRQVGKRNTSDSNFGTKSDSSIGAEDTGKVISDHGISPVAAALSQASKDGQAGKIIRDSGKTADLLQDGLAMPEGTQAHQLAEQLSEQLETALTEMGLDASELYHMSRADQTELIRQVTNKTLSDQSVGELARLVNQEYYQDKVTLNTPGEYGEKAVPYSARNIDIGERLKKYQAELIADGDFVCNAVGSFKNEDLAILTAETGVEYTVLTIGNNAYLIRGTEKSTTIPNDLLIALKEKRGTLDSHSHPFIGDLIPSETDREFLRMLTWQKDSLIIDPTNKGARYNPDGVIEMFNIETVRDENYYETLFQE